MVLHLIAKEVAATEINEKVLELKVGDNEGTDLRPSDFQQLYIYQVCISRDISSHPWCL